MEATDRFEDLVDIVKTLRRECPWDRRQTHDSIKDNLIEEAYETVEAIDQEDFDAFKKELGDLLLHVVFHSNMASETDDFDIGDVIRSLQEKLIRRHPHVYGEETVPNEEEVARNWENIKLEEGKTSILEGIPGSLPGLIRAQRMQEKVSNIGFDWPESESAWEKVDEELQELKACMASGDKQEASLEFGDLLFSLVNTARHAGLEAEDCIRHSNRKFERRFRHLEKRLAEDGKEIGEMSLSELDGYWEEAKGATAAE